MTGALTVAPPAKVNLHLEVKGRRGDGYHELVTLFQSIDLRDRLTAVDDGSGEVSLEVAPDGAVPAGEDANVVIRAVRAVAREIGGGGGARLRLDKRIPVGGGLGGGSADAAAALVLLDQLWDCGFDGHTLHRLAAEIGSDVPFFLVGGRVLGTGRGDELIELEDSPPLPVVIAAPPLEISTEEVFGKWSSRLTSNRPEGTLVAPAAGLRGQPEWRAMTNQLEEIVVGSWPEVGEGLRILRSFGPLHASLSGSGSASFAVFESRSSARRAAEGLPQGWFVHLGNLLPRSAARLEVVR